MRVWPSLIRGCRALFGKRRAEAELDEELRGYLDELAAAHVRAGLSAAAARRAARLEAGSLEGVKEKVRAAGWEAAVESLGRDAWYGLRMLRKTPAFTAVAVLALALGIGVNVTLFSVVSSLLLRPLPVAAPDRLTVLAFQRLQGPLQDNFSYAQLADIRDQTASVLAGVMGSQYGLDGLRAGAGVDRLLTAYVTGNYFTVLGIKPALGRFILPVEGATPGADPVIVLGYSYWCARFGGDRGIVGRKVLINGHPVTVVGVAPQGFHGVRPMLDPQGYLPLAMAIPLEGFSADFLTNRGIRNLLVVGRLRSGVGLRAAQAALALVARRLARQHPESDGGMRLTLTPESRARPRPQSSGATAALARLFLLLAVLVLLLAGVDVANLLLARATVRGPEMMLRAALGASRGRLVRQLLAESLVLAAMGGIAGVALAAWCCRLLASLQLRALGAPLLLDWSFDWRVLAYAAGAALVTGILVGLAPAFRVGRRDLTTALAGGSSSRGGRGAAGGSRGVAAGRHRLRDGLVAVQVGASLMLLIVAGLFTRSLARASRLDLGFDPGPVWNFSLDPGALGDSESQGRVLLRQILARVRALPGVDSASLASSLPMGDSYFENSLLIRDHPRPAGEPPPIVDYSMVSPGYFETLRIPVVAGRPIADADREETRPVAVVNQAMAARFWPHADPIGREFAKASHASRALRVVGVVKDVRNAGTAGAVEPFFYLPLAQDYAALQVLQIRTSRPPRVMVPAVRAAIAGLAPALPVFDVGSMRDALGGMRGFFMFEVGAGLAAAMGSVGLLLALFGVYGVVTYVASQRRREIGVRMALGASRSAVVGLMLRQGLAIVALGIAAGLAATLGMVRLLGSFLFGVGPTDAVTWAGVTALLALVALAACYLPARRVGALDPTTVLRCD